MAKTPLDPSLPIYQLKIQLDDVAPPIWRRIQTHNCTLRDLHEVIQSVMGWEDAHMYCFFGGECEFGDPEHEADYDDRRVRLHKFVEHGIARFTYVYDFGDDWRHTITIEKTLPIEKGVRYPRCISGKRAGPPDDCGGAIGYDELLERLESAEPDDEVFDWIDPDFDPEAFDLADINRELDRIRPWLGSKRAPGWLPAAFAKGDPVCVKPGTVHPEYPDIPLGGWVGQVRRIRWLVPVAYWVEWSEATLSQVHPVYFKRQQRDGEKAKRLWLDEECLQRASDAAPVAMEQPTQLQSTPLSPSSPMDCVRIVFGLTSDDPVPPVNHATLTRYADYLKASFAFPFPAEHLPWGSSEPRSVTVLRVLDQPLTTEDGIFCEALQEGTLEQVRLIDLTPDDVDTRIAIEVLKDWWWMDDLK